MRRHMHMGSKLKLSRVAVGMLALFVAVQVLPPFFGLHSPFGLATGLQTQNDPTACEAIGSNWTTCDNAFASDDTYAYANNDTAGGAGSSSPVTVVDLGAEGLLHEPARHIFKNTRGNGNYYAFFRDDATNFLRYRWSADGITWSASIDASAIAISPGEDAGFAVDFFDEGVADGAWVTILYQDNVPADKFAKYRRGQILDTADTITWGAESGAGGYSKPAERQNIQICGAARAWMISDWKAKVAVAINTGSTTVPPADFFAAHARVDWDATAGTFSADFGCVSRDEVWAVKIDTTAGDLVAAKWTTDGSTLTGPTNEASLGPSPTLTLHLISVVINNEATQNLEILYKDGTNLKHVRWNPTDGFGTPVTVFTGTVDSLNLAIDTTSSPNKLFAFYVKNSANTDVSFKTTPTDTINWGTENTIDDGGTEALDKLSVARKDWGADSKFPLLWSRQTSFEVRFSNAAEGGGAATPGKNDTAWKDFGFALGA
ncbi:MAG: hypothetical protein V3U17_01535, partial [Thermoplasmata archaeon]